MPPNPSPSNKFYRMRLNKIMGRRVHKAAVAEDERRSHKPVIFEYTVEYKSCQTRKSVVMPKVRDGRNRPVRCRRSNRPGKLSGKRTDAHSNSGETLARGRRRDSTLRQKDRGGANWARFLPDLVPGAWKTGEMGNAMPDLNRTPLYDLHVSLGAKMVPFAGYEMPVQYGLGVMKEHLWTREHAGLFDVSHMGQVKLFGDDVSRQFETLVPMDISGLKVGRQRYAFFTNDTGGIEDDLMVAKRDDHLFVVVNAACKAADVKIMNQLSDTVVEPITNRALLALQGPEAETAFARLVPDAVDMRFMDVATFDWNGVELWVSRSGYTGEDGYEISVPEQNAQALAEALLGMEEVEPIGLGARDSLRLEAGLCLYGQDMDGGLSPVEASLSWAIQKVRRRGGEREGGFPGADVILRQLEDGVHRHRVGLRPEGKAPMRREVPLFENIDGGPQIGFVTSGGFGPSIGAPVAMGIVADSLHTPGTQLFGEVRGKRMPVTVVDLPFRPSNFKRSTGK